MLLGRGKIGGDEDEETRGETEPRGRTGEVMRSLWCECWATAAAPR